MNNTKTIFKSLLIMIVAISLFTVSCSKDEGGTKNPTNPTPKNSEALLTDMLKGLGELKDTDNKTVILSLANIDPQKGSAEISGANNSKEGSDYKVVTVLKNTFKKANFTGQIILKEDLTAITVPTGGNNNPLEVVITFIANTGYTFDDSITKGKRYTYSDNDKTAKLTLKISPKGQWQN